jgi:hypothetical protein
MHLTKIYYATVTTVINELMHIILYQVIEDQLIMNLIKFITKTKIVLFAQHAIINNIELTYVHIIPLTLSPKGCRDRS